VPSLKTRENTAQEKMKRPLQNDQFLWYYYSEVYVWVKLTFLTPTDNISPKFQRKNIVI
jgi:hypothetical protein